MVVFTFLQLAEILDNDILVLINLLNNFFLASANVMCLVTRNVCISFSMKHTSQLCYEDA